VREREREKLIPVEFISDKIKQFSKAASIISQLSARLHVHVSTITVIYQIQRMEKNNFEKHALFW
jgi:hypothetical protein